MIEPFAIGRTKPKPKGRAAVRLFECLRSWARAIKIDVMALWLAARDARTPWVARGVALAVTAYALSPIDLIPDFVPILGYLDDLVIVPLGILLAVRLVGRDLMAEFRARAEAQARLPSSRIGTAIVIGLWILAIVGAGWWRARVSGW